MTVSDYIKILLTSQFSWVLIKYQKTSFKLNTDSRT